MPTVKRALIQKTRLNEPSYGCGPWWSSNCKDAARGLKKLGYQIEGFTPETLASAPLRKSTVVKGSIGMVRRALEHLGVPQPENLDIPESLKKFTFRKIWTTTLGQVRKKNETVFIKPLHYQKAFAGHIYRGKDLNYNRSVDWLTKDFDNKFPILASEPVEFRGEWRAYILKGEILGVREYHGSYYTPPHRSKVQEMVQAYKDAPAAYALDVGYIYGNSGLLKHTEHLALVEVNEGFSLGNYGISSLDYARMVEARWKEMVRAA